MRLIQSPTFEVFVALGISTVLHLGCHADDVPQRSQQATTLSPDGGSSSTQPPVKVAALSSTPPARPGHTPPPDPFNLAGKSTAELDQELQQLLVSRVQAEELPPLARARVESILELSNYRRSKTDLNLRLQDRRGYVGEDAVQPGQPSSGKAGAP